MKYLRVINDLLTADECTKLIHFFESQPTQHIDRVGFAEYERVEMDDPGLAQELWRRLKNIPDLQIPSSLHGGQTVGLNEHFRFSKYHPGMEFDIHKDGVNQDRHGHRSAYTLNIFLNEDFEGGETDFFLENNRDSLRFSVTPQIGKAALFDAQQYHSGNRVTRGFKYLLRTDLMVN